jgi:predicted metal-dependent hydrolase
VLDGEGFLYLGRSYRLRLVKEADAAVKLGGGRFVMPAALARDGREHLIRWYRERAQSWLTAKVEDYAARMEVAPAGVKVQDLGYRWGSCGKGDWLYFHWKTILLPARIAEYVVVHRCRICMNHITRPNTGDVSSALCRILNGTGPGLRTTVSRLKVSSLGAHVF